VKFDGNRIIHPGTGIQPKSISNAVPPPRRM